MKEIWINLELYFKRYDFYNFQGFSGFFWIFMNFIFDFKCLKEFKKMQKAFNIRAGPHGCDVALRATWQRHAGPRGIYIYIYIFDYIL